MAYAASTCGSGAVPHTLAGPSDGLRPNGRNFRQRGLAFSVSSTECSASQPRRPIIEGEPPRQMVSVSSSARRDWP